MGEKKVNEEGITFAIETRDTRGDEHEIIKRPFNGRRQETFHVLKIEGNGKCRKHEARRLMLPGDIEPPILPGTDVLRQAKRGGIDKNFGIDKLEGRDIVRSIEDMNLSPQYWINPGRRIAVSSFVRITSTVSSLSRISSFEKKLTNNMR